MAQVTRTKGLSIETLNARIKELDGYETRAGWFESSKYEDGTPVAYVASIQEFGVPERSIPARPFMRPTIDKDAGSWAILMGQGAAGILRGTTDNKSVMEALGLKASGDIAKTITQIYDPPLSPITLELRARRARGDIITGKTVGEAAAAVAASGYETPDVNNKPLEDTKKMYNEVTSVVLKNK